MCIEKVDPQPEIPEQVRGPCQFCGSERTPVFLKPVRESAAWWEDPHGWWACGKCRRERFNPTDARIEEAVQEFLERERRQDPDSE